MASEASGVSPALSAITTLLRRLLITLTPIGRFGEEEMMAGVVVGLPLPVLHNQDLHPAQPTREVLPALDARLRPQRGCLQQR
jgi:hypothetical protein